ncbi:hypothetical protein SOPP22_07190 [Shewanella sp. OPT22]|nr:hypothetical protein SOPP22_07190 [Shewanella sp. OPT22]
MTGKTTPTSIALQEVPLTQTPFGGSETVPDNIHPRDSGEVTSTTPDVFKDYVIAQAELPLSNQEDDASTRMCLFQRSAPKDIKSADKEFKTKLLATEDRLRAFYIIKEHNEHRRTLFNHKKDYRYINTPTQLGCYLNQTGLTINKIQLNPESILQRINDDVKRANANTKSDFEMDFKRGCRKSTFHFVDNKITTDTNELEHYFGEPFRFIYPVIYQRTIGTLAEVAKEMKPELSFACPTSPVTVYHHKKLDNGAVMIKLKSSLDIYLASTPEQQSAQIEAMKADRQNLQYLSFELELELSDGKYKVINAQVSYISQSLAR